MAQKSCKLVWQNTSNHKGKKAKRTMELAKSNLIKNIISRASEIRDQVLVVKIASVIIENDELLDNFVDNIRLLNMCGTKIVIVHDYTKLVEETLGLLGCNEKFIDNHQVPNYKKDQIIEMVLSGHINKHIVARLCANGCFAVGISGKDGNLMQAKKSKLFYKRSEQDVIDINFISEPIIVNAEILLNFEDSNIIPVISPIANDKNGRTHLLDINLTASVVASCLGADHLILPQDECIFGNQDLVVQDVQVLRNMLQIDDTKPSSLVRSALYALENNTNCVYLIDASIYDSVLSNIFLNQKVS